MSSLSNVKDVNINGSPDRYVRDDRRNLPNGLPISLPDRTLPRQPHSDTNGNGVASAYPGQWTDADDGYSDATTPIAFYPTEKIHLRDAAPPLQTIPSDTEPPIPGPIHSNSFPNSNSTPQKNSPHRLSSPPAPTSSSTSNLSMSAHLYPPQSSSTLKQRHTLEVPKVSSGSGRPSRDGLSMDAATASGRFSPVAASGARRASLSLARRTTRSMQSEAPRDEVVPDEDAQRWAEAYRQKRASKRKRKVDEDEDRVLVGTKVDESHANWVTAYNMLTGIRVSVSRTNAKLDRELNDADFQVKQKSTFDM